MKKFLIGLGVVVAVGTAVGVYFYKKISDEIKEDDIFEDEEDLDFCDKEIADDLDKSFEDTTPEASVQ